MPDQPLQCGVFYHIYNRGNNRENLFVQERNFPYFMRLYAKHIYPVAETFAYCLMPNHFHFLIRTRTEEEQHHQIGPISKIGPIWPSHAFNNLFIAYARAFNKATGRTGVLFERPFHRKLVTSAAYFRRLVVNIHLSPQKHGFVEDFREWKWSSYGTLRSGGNTQLERAAVLDWFGDQEAFEDGHREAGEDVEIEDWIEVDF